MIGLLVPVVAINVPGVFAADKLLDVAIYVTGNFGNPTWSPGTGAGPGGSPEELRLYDDGKTNGDQIADDGIWTCIVTGMDPFTEIEWKIASPGWSPINAPDSSTTNLRTYVAENGTVSFFFDTNPQEDGLKPDAGSPNKNGFAYSGTLWETLQPVDSVSLSGSFQTQLGGTDWDPTDPSSQIILTDDGAKFDTAAGDGIYTGSVQGLENGTYEYKGVLNYEDFTTPKYSAMGYSSGGGNLKFTVFDRSEVIVFQFDSRRSRLGPVGVSAQSGPPFYAHCSAWGNSFTSLEDMGTTTDNVYRKAFTVAEPGAYTFRIRDKALKEYPQSGDYPFVTTQPNQEIWIVFDRNQYDDPYEPSANIVLAVDNATKTSLNVWEYVQMVGDWMIDFGGASDWNAADYGFAAFDEGLASDGDAAAGDGVFAIRLETSATATNKQMKAVGKREELGDSDWAIQLGGPGEGITWNTTNTNMSFSYTPGTYTFQVDTLTGRVGVGTTPPKRPSLTAPVAIEDWSLLE